MKMNTRFKTWEGEKLAAGIIGAQHHIIKLVQIELFSKKKARLNRASKLTP